MEPKTAIETQDDELDVLQSVRVVRKYWWMEVGLVLAVCVITGVYSLLLPKEYEATASVVPSTDTESAGGLRTLAAQTGIIPSLAATSNKDIFVGILKSRTMLDEIIRKFDLIKAYKLEGSRAPMQRSRAKLAAMTDINVSREGVISIAVTAYEPRMAADIANFYVENLDRLNTTINVTQAGSTRLFLEGRVAEAKKALKSAEDRLKEFQARSKAVVMEGQAKTAIESAARLEGQILAAEVQLKTLETFSTEWNPDVIKTKEAIDEMRRQLKRMEYGRQRAEGGGQRTEGAGEGGAAGDYSVALGSIPTTAVELARLIRETKIQETIYTLLTQQLEQAKIAEAKDTPAVRILDRAVVPEWKSRPSVRQNVMIAGASSLFIAIFLAFFLEYLEVARKRTPRVTHG